MGVLNGLFTQKLVLIYSLSSSRSTSLWLFFLCRTQNIFWWTW